MQRYQLVSSQSGVPARFFIFDVESQYFKEHGRIEPVLGANTCWLLINNGKEDINIGFVIRSADRPDDLIASLGLSQFFLQFKDDSSLYAVLRYDKTTHVADIEFSGSILGIDLGKEYINSVWVKEPYNYFDGNALDNMEIMTKLMMFDFKPNKISKEGTIGYNPWGSAIDPWNKFLQQ
jgi:hypothetical protein